jgi:acyl-CoA reductase-like NAD-dependent aldehyde dehydrogenase
LSGAGIGDHRPGRWIHDLPETRKRGARRGLPPTSSDISAAGELKGEPIPLGEHVLSYMRREPLGVVGAIIPSNAPVLLGALKIAPALCAGNTLVLKAAEDAPLGVLVIAEICQEFLPAGCSMC